MAAAAAGIRRLRLSPHTADMLAVARIYRAVLDEAVAPAEGRAALRAIGLPGELVDGYARGVPGCAPAAVA